MPIAWAQTSYSTHTGGTTGYWRGVFSNVHGLWPKITIQHSEENSVKVHMFNQTQPMFKHSPSLKITSLCIGNRLRW